jgi:hypothetical protein
MSSTHVHYWVPVDGDDQANYNMYRMRKPIESITLRDIHESFPLPGDYYFRFKDRYESTYGP